MAYFVVTNFWLPFLQVVVVAIAVCVLLLILRNFYQQQLIRNFHLEASNLIQREKLQQALHTAFPPEFAHRILLGKPLSMVKYYEIPILHLDLVGFTRMCSSSDPYALNSKLVKLFAEFDDIVTSYHNWRVDIGKKLKTAKLFCFDFCFAARLMN